jgi:hypothetical protein
VSRQKINKEQPNTNKALSLKYLILKNNIGMDIATGFSDYNFYFKNLVDLISKQKQNLHQPFYIILKIIN